MRHVHEVFLSLNVAWACLEISQATSQYASYAFMQVYFTVMAHTHVRFHTRGAAAVDWVTFLVFWLSGSAAILLVVRLLEMFGLRRLLLRSVAGFAALVAAPATWYFYFWGSFIRPWQIRASWEVIVAVLLAFLYLCGWWPLPRWAGSALLAAHCAFWCWYFWVSLYSVALLISPLLAFASSLAWGIYVSDEALPRDIADSKIPSLRQLRSSQTCIRGV